MQEESVKRCSEGYMCPRCTLLSGVWNLFIQVDSRAAAEAEDDPTPVVMWEDLTPTEQAVFADSTEVAMDQMGELIARIATINLEHQERK